MNVKNLDQFLKDIDQEKVVDWNMNQDCHEKIKKITLQKQTVLREESYSQNIQITLENNPDYRVRHPRHYGPNPEKRWETPVVDISEDLIEQKMRERRKSVILPEKVKRDLSKLLDYPLYDGNYYYQNGEKTR